MLFKLGVKKKFAALKTNHFTSRWIDCCIKRMHLSRQPHKHPKPHNGARWSSIASLTHLGGNGEAKEGGQRQQHAPIARADRIRPGRLRSAQAAARSMRVGNSLRTDAQCRRSHTHAQTAVPGRCVMPSAPTISTSVEHVGGHVGWIARMLPQGPAVVKGQPLWNPASSPREHPPAHTTPNEAIHHVHKPEKVGPRSVGAPGWANRCRHRML